MKTLLADNPELHGPVADKDCSACHNPHGGENFRLLNHEYPAQFYSAFDPKLYALCFECHEETIVTKAETTTLTQFRNGSTNLHFVHVNKADRGRTCRACHDVHAAKQKHQLRDGVPYGSKGWILKLNYTKTPNGGSCEKTCHESRSYTNVVAALAAKPAAPDAKSLVPEVKSAEVKSAPPPPKSSVPEWPAAAPAPSGGTPNPKP
jgi:predicted CXXCH cytochrome family protein